ncbi:hypothetical protein CDQ91_06305 [Sphingopyxis witflariensis]|uniref:EthD domain-containing protein n=2 Tax=Sphingopyxis witflariensis TaxID=173675 RepID=A0A246K5X4_9SPHN|nr:hypothetical protein CDQ91_06305 [Sphingopyxis witflariensis]
MIKMLCQVPRKQGMSEAEFYPRYLHGHGDLVRNHAQAMGFLRYIQAHRIDLPEIAHFSAGRPWRSPLDGQSELWWESWERMESALGSPEGIDASALLETDEQAFTDTSNVSGFIALEDVILDQSDGLPPGSGPAVKMVIDIWKRPDLCKAEFSGHWRTKHADLIRQHATALGISKYVQNHGDPEAKFDFADLRGWRPAPSGVTEMWWPSMGAMRQALASPEAISAVAAIRQDEDGFTDPALTRAFAAKERSIFDYIGATSVV